MTTIQKIKRAIVGDKWQVVRTIWPYKDGYGTYNKSTRTLLDSG